MIKTFRKWVLKVCNMFPYRRLCIESVKYKRDNISDGFRVTSKFSIFFCRVFTIVIFVRNHCFQIKRETVTLRLSKRRSTRNRDLSLLFFPPSGEALNRFADGVVACTTDPRVTHQTGSDHIPYTRTRIPTVGRPRSVKTNSAAAGRASAFSREIE